MEHEHDNVSQFILFFASSFTLYPSNKHRLVASSIQISSCMKHSTYIYPKHFQQVLPHGQFNNFLISSIKFPRQSNHHPFGQVHPTTIIIEYITTICKYGRQQLVHRTHSTSTTLGVNSYSLFCNLISIQQTWAGNSVDSNSIVARSFLTYIYPQNKSFMIHSRTSRSST